MARRHPKREFLEQSGALHRWPDRVQADLFERHRFFDPFDKVQVKYEMLRAHAVDGRSVVAVAKDFGFSRETYYLKLTDEAADWVLALHRRRPKMSGRELAEALADELGIEVHRRTIERLLGGGRKKND